MPETRRMPPVARFERARGDALRTFLRRFRHEISTPLSGANLHLEVALRRIQKPGGFDPAAVLENLRTCQQSIETAAGMLDLIAEVSRAETEEPSEFSLAESLGQAVEPFRVRARERGLLLDAPAAAPGPRWFGSARELEGAIAELTRNALEHSSPPGSIRWTIGQGPSGVELVCRSPGRLPPGDSEHLFGVAKGAASGGRGFGLLQARRAVQGNGAELALFQEGDEVCAALRFPASLG